MFVHIIYTQRGCSAHQSLSICPTIPLSNSSLHLKTVDPKYFAPLTIYCSIINYQNTNVTFKSCGCTYIL